MNYATDYTARFYAKILDPATWVETDTLELIDGSVKRQNSDLRQSASLTVDNFDQNKESWIRIYMDAVQSGDVDHVALFTGIVSSPKRDINGNVITRELECYSVLEPLADILLEKGWYIPAGTNAGDAIKKLMTATPAPLQIAENTPLLSDYLIAEGEENNLTMVDKILDAIGWQMLIKGDGTIVVRPVPKTRSVIFGSKSADIIEKSLTITRDWFKCPNVFRATSGNAVAIARDDDPDSMLSTVSRGREVIMGEEDVNLSSNEGIGQYAQRRLEEEQSVVESAEYDRRFVPELNVGDIISLDYEQVSGTFMIEDQTINLTYNAQTGEKVSR